MISSDSELFDRLVRGFLDEELADSVRQTDLSADSFVDEARRNADEILADVSEEQAHRDELRAQLNQREGRQVSLAFLAALGAYLPAAVLLGGRLLPTWALIVMGVVGVPLLSVAFAVPLAAWERRRRAADAPPATKMKGGEPQGSIPLKERLATAQSDFESALSSSLFAWLSSRVNAELGEIYAAELPEVNPRGLAEVDDPEREISTDVEERLESLISGMPGGSIGIAGPRGAGKTTLLNRVTTAPLDPSPPVAATVVVDAPVEYDARDFVLHLFARLCEEVLGEARVDALRGRPSPHRRSPLWPPPTISHLARWILRRPSATQRGDLGAIAETHLRQIWFEQSVSAGWSGSLTIPFKVGLGFGREKSVQRAERPLSFPDVVSSYKRFISLLTAGGAQVRIGIDELDKMDDDRARRFLNEIKVIFRVRRCFYLVSVSEDAMSYFERRGLPFRDVFDSSFDDVVRVHYLPFQESHRLLRRRVVGLPVQLALLCHMLGGGLARDVIRFARGVCEEPAGSALDQIVRRTSERQLEAKCEAARVAVRRLEDPEHIVLVSEWVRKLTKAAPREQDVLARCAGFEQEFVHPLEASSRGEGDGPRERREALSIALELLAFAYFLTTLRELLPTLATEQATRQAIADSTIERLAEARQAFAVNPSEAWSAISAAREARQGMTPTEFPLSSPTDALPASTVLPSAASMSR